MRSVIPREFSCVLVLTLAACGEQPAPGPQTGSAGAVSRSQSAGAMASAALPVCEAEQLAQALPLTMIPGAPPDGPGIALFRQAGSSCLGEPAQVVLYNGSSQAIEIEALGIEDAHFEVAGPALPYSLQAGDTLPLQISFSSEMGKFKSKLSVRTTQGCAQFGVNGTAVDASTAAVTMPRPYVVSFGHVAAGSTSEPIEFSLHYLPRAGAPRDKVGSIGSATAGLRVEPLNSSPGGDAGACEAARARVRLTAPQRPGLFRGQLTWEVEGESSSALSITDVVGVID